MDSETSPPASSSNLCFSRAGQFSLYRFPCATKEHRRVGKTPFSPDDGLNFSAERGTLFLQVLEAAEKLHLCLLSYSLAKWVYVQQRQKFLCIHPVRTVANLNAHRWLAGQRRKGMAQSSASWRRESPVNGLCPSSMEFQQWDRAAKPRAKLILVQAQPTELAQTFNQTRWKVYLHH